MDVCYLFTWADGNKLTVDNWCGKDEDFGIIHDKDKPFLHFDGCGINFEICTK